MRSTAGARYTAVRPTLADFVLKMPRGAQVIYPKDLGPDPRARRHLPRRPRARVRRRVGGAVDDARPRRRRRRPATSCARTSRPRPSPTSPSFLGAEVGGALPGRAAGRLRRHRRDRPRPHRARPARAVAGREERRGRAPRRAASSSSYLPTIGQVAQLRAALDGSRFAMAETLEVLHRTWHVEGASVRPGPSHGRPHRVPDPRPAARRLERPRRPWTCSTSSSSSSPRRRPSAASGSGSSPGSCPGSGSASG